MAEHNTALLYIIDSVLGAALLTIPYRIRKLSQRNDWEAKAASSKTAPIMKKTAEAVYNSQSNTIGVSRASIDAINPISREPRGSVVVTLAEPHVPIGETTSVSLRPNDLIVTRSVIRHVSTAKIRPTSLEPRGTIFAGVTESHVPLVYFVNHNTLSKTCFLQTKLYYEGTDALGQRLVKRTPIVATGPKVRANLWFGLTSTSSLPARRTL